MEVEGGVRNFRTTESRAATSYLGPEPEALDVLNQEGEVVLDHVLRRHDLLLLVELDLLGDHSMIEMFSSLVELAEDSSIAKASMRNGFS